MHFYSVHLFSISADVPLTNRPNGPFRLLTDLKLTVMVFLKSSGSAGVLIMNQFEGATYHVDRQLQIVRLAFDIFAVFKNNLHK